MENDRKKTNGVEVLTFTDGNKMVRVFKDIYAECPCKEYDMAGFYIFSKDKRKLHEKCNQEEVFADGTEHSIKEALQVLADRYVPIDHVTNALKNGTSMFIMQYDTLEKTWLAKGKSGGTIIRIKGTKENITEQKYKMLGLCFTENDLITLINTSDANITVASLDFGNRTFGIGFCTKEHYIKYVNKDSSNWKVKAMTAMMKDAEDIAKWNEGNVCGYSIEYKKKYIKKYEDGTTEEGFDWVEEDSQWGCYEEPNELAYRVINEYK